MLRYILIGLAGLQLVGAATHQEFFSAPASAGHEGECNDYQTGKSYKLGEKWTAGGCKQATCILTPDRYGVMTNTIRQDSCPDVRPGKGCRRAAGDRRKPYPGCCPKEQCRKTTGGKVVTISGGGGNRFAAYGGGLSPSGGSTITVTGGNRNKFAAYGGRYSGGASSSATTKKPNRFAAYGGRYSGGGSSSVTTKKPNRFAAYGGRYSGGR